MDSRLRGNDVLLQWNHKSPNPTLAFHIASA
jgi:hypothetical protein